MLQDFLEVYIDVDVGNTKKIEPVFLIEEKFDCLIIGDCINEAIPSLKLQNWLLKYREISNSYNLIVKVISGFYIVPSDIKIEPFWVESLQNYINAEIIYPPILRLKLNRREIALKNGAYDIIKEYSNDFIEFLINDKMKKEK